MCKGRICYIRFVGPKDIFGGKPQQKSGTFKCNTLYLENNYLNLVVYLKNGLLLLVQDFL